MYLNKTFAAIVITVLFSQYVPAAPDSKLIPFWASYDNSSMIQLNHDIWQSFLNDYLIETNQNNQKQTLLNYSAVTPQDRTSLKNYLAAMSSVDPRTLDRSEQKAYWINLYNAQTVETVLEHYPIDSILDIRSSWFIPGPWRNKVLMIVGQPLSLNDIEHGILRPLFKDPRLHYALNCASLGCPNLLPSAFTRHNSEELLEVAAIDFINSNKGVNFTSERVLLSSIYDWYEADFGNDEDLWHHIRYYLRESVDINSLSDIEFHYDWQLNEAGK